jgi:hypothetical protein
MHDDARRGRSITALARAGGVPALSESEVERLAGRISAAAARRIGRRSSDVGLADGLARWAPWIIRVAVAAGIVGLVLLTREPIQAGQDASDERSAATDTFLAAVSGEVPREQVLAAVVWPLDGSWALAKGSSQ